MTRDLRKLTAPEKIEIIDTAAHTTCELLKLLYTLQLTGMNWKIDIMSLRRIRDELFDAGQELEKAHLEAQGDGGE